MRRIFELSSKYQVYKDLLKKGGVLKLIGFSPPPSPYQCPLKGLCHDFHQPASKKREKAKNTLLAQARGLQV